MRCFAVLALLTSVPALAGGPVHTGDICQLALLMERHKHTTSATRRNTEDAYNQFWNLQHKILGFDAEIEPTLEPVSGSSLDGAPAANAREIAQRTQGLAHKYLAEDGDKELVIGSVIRGQDKILEHLAKYGKELDRRGDASDDEFRAIIEVDHLFSMFNGGPGMIGSSVNLEDFSAKHPFQIDLMKKALEKGLRPQEFVFDSVTGKLDRNFIQRFWQTGLVSDNPLEWRSSPVAAPFFLELFFGSPASWVLVDHVLMIDEESNPPQPALAIFIRTSHKKPKFPKAKRRKDVRVLKPLLQPNATPALVPVPVRPK